MKYTELDLIKHPYLIFFREDIQGHCSNPSKEFGNLYRKEIECKYFKNGECHYTGECEAKIKFERGEEI